MIALAAPDCKPAQARPKPRFTRSCDYRAGCGCPVCLVRCLEGARGTWHAAKTKAERRRPAPPSPPATDYVECSNPWSG